MGHPVLPRNVTYPKATQNLPVSKDSGVVRVGGGCAALGRDMHGVRVEAEGRGAAAERNAQVGTPARQWGHRRN